MYNCNAYIVCSEHKTDEKNALHAVINLCIIIHDVY